jgi:excisionase family DNA binding protein
MAAKKDKLMSVTEISEQAKISRQRILQIIESGDLKAQMVGRNYVIFQSDFDVWSSSRRETGRPKKVAAQE